MSLGMLASHLDATKPQSASQRAQLHVSFPRSGSTVVVPRNNISVLVQIADTHSESVSIKVSDRAELVYMRQSADVFSLSPGSVAIVQKIPIHSVVQYDIPRASFHEFASRHAQSEVSGFQVNQVTSDAVLYLLSRSVGSLLGADTPPSKKFAQYFALLVYSHLAECYGTQGQEAGPASGGFSPRNRRLVEGQLHDSSGANIAMEALAARCRLSIRQFARAFQKSFGVTFYQFQLGLRVQRAKVLLIHSDLTLRALAEQLGYADQATFTESFTRVVGIPPGRYRRRYFAAKEDQLHR